MFGQPRCREWTPLATQQLRLRSLIQIVGYNIHEEDGSAQTGSLYYTLHTTTMSAPFYTSEKLLSNHPKWREIDSELIHKMSSTSVVVRIWRHTRHDNLHSLHAPSDTVVQTWGVNFNGLLHIGANLALDFSPKSFKNNTVVFQMIGGYFCSYDSLKLEPSLKIPNIEHTKKDAVLGKEASPSRKIPIDKNSRLSSESKSVSPGKGWKAESFDPRAVSKSHSPPVGCFRQSYGTYKSSISNLSHTNRQDYYRAAPDGRERKRSDSYNSSIYEHSPKSENDVEIKEYMGSDESSDALKSCGSLSASSRDLHGIDVEESEQAEHFDPNVPPVPKCRYSTMKFLKSEIRPSYTSEKLQKLHLLQYMIKKRTEAVQEIKEKIYKKSAIENCEDLSPHGALVDNEDFSRSEKLSMSCREYSLFSGKNKSASRSLGKLLSESNLSLQSSEKDLSKTNSEIVQENRDDIKSRSLPPDKVSSNIRRNAPSNKYLGNNLTQSDRRFTLPLNKLLEFKSQPSPSQRLRHSQLTRQAELSRFKRRLLQDERDAALAKLRRLRQEKCRIFEENQDNSTELMESYHSLSRKAEQLRELKKSEAALKELYQRSSSLLLARRWRLVQDLLVIYPIFEDESGGYQILNISLPACKDNSDGLRQCSEADLAVALGRVAHLTALAASLLGAPLRHPVRLMGSRTKVLDHVAQENELPNRSLLPYDAKYWLNKWKFIPENKYLPAALYLSLYFSHRLIPLFARNKDSMMFRYGLFLLNRNIAQLLWATHRLITPDPRDTLANLKRLLTPPTVTTGLDASRLFGSGSSMETTGTGTAIAGLIHPMSTSSLLGTTPSPRGVSLGTVHSHQSLRTMIPKHHHHRPFNRFKDSVDGTSPKQAMLTRKHRYSRSVGSYVDEQSLQALDMDSSVIGSEPSLLLLDSPVEVHAINEPTSPSSQQEKNMQSLISFSESDLTKVTDIISPETRSSTNDLCQTKVVFSLGDDYQTPDDSRKSPKRQSVLSKSKSLETDNTELQELKCDVDRLSKEIQVLYDDCEKDLCGSTGKSDDHFVRRCSNANEDTTIKCLDFSVLSDGNSADASNICYEDEDREFLLNVRSFEAYENKSDEDVATISNVVPDAKNDEREINQINETSIDQTDSVTMKKAASVNSCAVDIEKFAFPPFCNQPCDVVCPRSSQCPQFLKTGYDQCENGQETMQDVIVLPSAEAVMTTSSHFTDSPLFDSQSRGDHIANISSDSELPMDEDELVSLAKRVLKFEDEEKSKSILAVLKGSSIENDDKTENEMIIKYNRDANSCLCSCKNNSKDITSTKCCRDDRICDNDCHKDNDSNNVHSSLKSDKNILSSNSLNESISVKQSDTSLSSPNDRLDLQTKSEDVRNIETLQDKMSKPEVNGYS